ncbi:MAG: carboxymuconolactone decarboxylase family protein [Alphaproteobacteria bacterium]|nr:carboxymuconolactone decarboxylase family protein [Alphaproteobacteria bacterium]
MRMPPLDPQTMSPEQKRAYDAITSGPRGSAARGPFNAWLRSPGFCDPAQRAGAHCRFGNALPPRLFEIAILCTARFWSAQFEWYAHAKLAAEAGVAPEIIEAIRQRQTPVFRQADEALVYEFASELYRTRAVSDALYARALKAFGERGLVDLVGTMGYYCMVSLSLNAFQVPLPPGEKLPLD